MSKELKNSFDRNIKDVIGNHQVPYDDHSWDMLEQKMSQLDMSSEQSIDDKAREAVKNLEVPYRPASWEVLSERLDRINYRKRLIASKVFEAAVIFFAIFTMVKFLGQIPEVQDLLPKSFVYQEQIESSDQNLIPNAVSTEREHQEYQSNALSEILTGGNAVSLPKSSESTKKADSQGRTSELNRLPILNAQVTTPHRLIVTHENRIIHESSAIQSLDIAINTQAPALDRRQKKAESVPMLPVSDMAMLQAETAYDFHIVAANPPAKIQTKVGVFYQNNIHLINRLVDGGRIPQQTVKSNKGLGFVTNVQFGKFGFDLGGSYHKLTYDAGVGSSYIEKIQIPLNIRYNGIHTKYADFYALAGASAHAVLRADYASPAYLNAAGPTKKRRFNDGLLEDGDKITNVYYSVNAGLGVDIPVYKNIGVFAEAFYQDHWKGAVGYTNDKIRTFSYNFGVTSKL